jgi:hypothetical protein
MCNSAGAAIMGIIWRARQLRCRFGGRGNSWKQFGGQYGRECAADSVSELCISGGLLERVKWSFRGFIDAKRLARLACDLDNLRTVSVNGSTRDTIRVETKHIH